MENKKYPGVFLRVKAAVFDSIVIIVFIGITTDIFSRFDNVPNYAKMIAFLFIFVLYDPIMVSFFGSTFGHKINNLKVQNLDTGKRINIGFAILRFFTKAFLGVFSFFTVETNENKQAIHDSFVNSVVVYDD